jgi:hypothetical protein
MSSERRLLMLVDGHAMVFRAWFSIPERLSTATGVDTRGRTGSSPVTAGPFKDRHVDHRASGRDADFSSRFGRL